MLMEGAHQSVLRGQILVKIQIINSPRDSNKREDVQTSGKGTEINE